MPLELVASRSVELKSHPEFDEAWLQSVLAEAPSLLGLGDELIVLDRERRQARAGRLDMLLSDQDSDTRYEVELMLGATDESHIIRTIEYWDIERRRYPGYDHIAVLVAENVTARFLNVISLFAGTIPMVVIQLDALEVEGKLVLNFVHVIDQRSLRIDDTGGVASPEQDRSAWEKRCSKSVMLMIDRIFSIIDEAGRANRSGRSLSPNYTKSYVGVSYGGRRTTFIQVSPRKDSVWVRAAVDDPEEIGEHMERDGFVVETQSETVKVRLDVGADEKQWKWIDSVIHNAVMTFLETKN